MFLIFTVFSMPLFGESFLEVDQAIQLAYNFQFDQAEDSLLSFRQRNPDDFQGDLGQVVYDFMRIKQNPLDENFKRLYRDVDVAENKLENLLDEGDSTLLVFYQCFLDYYLMKSYALEERWIYTASYALKARELAVELENELTTLPDLYFILGEQDYTTALVPDYLEPLLRGLNFTPDKEVGLANIHRASMIGGLTRYEATLMYISSCLYIEQDFPAAIKASEAFLKEFPGNLSVRYFNIDLMLRTNRITEAEYWIERLESEIVQDGVAGKWIPRQIQMKGNLFNAQGDFARAVESYEEALTYDELSGYTATEITLEMGKLLDILGRRREAEAVYKECYRGNGMSFQRDEARALKKDAYTGSRGSY